MKILCVAGSRGERAKLSPVIAALEGEHEVACAYASHPGQVPTWDADARPPDALALEIAQPTPALRIGAVMRWVEPLLEERGSDILLTCGASDAALGAAVAASLAGIVGAHLDAGVVAANGNLNARLLEQSAVFLLAPNVAAAQRLAHRGMENATCLCGDTLADSFDPAGAPAEAPAEPYVLCYLGGAALGANALPAVLGALERIGRVALLPAAPEAQARLEGAPAAQRETVRVIPPLDYSAMQAAVAGASLVITDSPTLQRESYFRATVAVGLAPSDFPEAESAGWVRRVAPEEAAILEAARAPAPEAPPEIEAHRGAGARAARFVTGL